MPDTPTEPDRCYGCGRPLAAEGHGPLENMSRWCSRCGGTARGLPSPEVLVNRQLGPMGKVTPKPRPRRNPMLPFEGR